MKHQQHPHHDHQHHDHQHHHATKTGSNSQAANERATHSNNAAHHARIARDARRHDLVVLHDWKAIFSNSPLVIVSGLFIFSILMEVVFSWPMYDDLMSQMTGKANPVLSLVGATFIVLWGAFASHLISKKMSPAVLNYTIYNKMDGHTHTPHAVAEERAHIEARNDFIVGLVLAVVLMIIVAAISWQRVWLLVGINGTDYGFMHKLLPVICVMVEIISGIYISYLIRRFRRINKVHSLGKKFLVLKSICAHETRMAYEHHDHAVRNHEPIHYSRDLRDALYRFEHRGHDHENYIDEIPDLKTLKVVVTNHHGPVAGVHLGGTLSSGEYCNSISTNELGEGTLTWDSDSKEITTVYTDNHPHHGHFRENSTIRIDLETTN